MPRSKWWIVLAVVPLMTWFVEPASAATTVASWAMNETSGAVMNDASASNNDGTIGSKVMLTGSSYQFPAANTTFADPARLVKVPHAASLNSGTQPLRITVQFKTTSAGEHNLMQKGQSGTAGGFWKLELNPDGPTPGKARCTFKGGNGGASVTAAPLLNDGQWHTISCRKTSTTITVTIDGVTTTRSARVGSITNTYAISLGGKLSCNPPAGVECDYYVGELANGLIEVG
jgi:hypothetical protein